MKRIILIIAILAMFCAGGILYENTSAQVHTGETFLQEVNRETGTIDKLTDTVSRLNGEGFYVVSVVTNADYFEVVAVRRAVINNGSKLGKY